MTKRLLASLAALLILASPAAGARKSKSNVLDLKNSVSDSSIVFPEAFERDSQRLLEGWYMRNYTSLDPDAPDPGNPQVSDDMIRRRLAALPTVIEMPFNQVVRSYIDRYMERSRKQVSAILGLSNYYTPIFEQALEERGLPLELKYLPVIESGLDPNAVSTHGAAGLWQFMLATAKGMGLEVSSLVDERRDPYASSAAAADYLKSLHDTYGDWSLAIAAYNCGPNAVNKAIRRAGGDPKHHDFWSIYEYLSPETRGYVPMFIAANYVMTYYPEHGISPVLPTKPLVTDTVHVADRVHFNQISKVLDIPVEELRILNPQYRADLIPATAGRQYTLILPSRQTQAYIMSQEDILAYEAERYARRDQAEPGDEAPLSEEPRIVVSQIPVAERPEGSDDQGPTIAAANASSRSDNAVSGGKTIVHKVAKGETLAAIAQTYGVTASDIRAWNHLRRNAVRAGQQLKIQPSASYQANNGNSRASRASETKTNATQSASVASRAAQSSAQSKSTASKKNQKTQKAQPAKPQSHEIKNGESLSSISKKYGVTVEQLKAANGLKNDNIRAGKSLTIPVKGTSGSSGKATGSKKSKKSSSKSSKSSKKSKKRR